MVGRSVGALKLGPGSPPPGPAGHRPLLLSVQWSPGRPEKAAAGCRGTELIFLLLRSAHYQGTGHYSNCSHLRLEDQAGLPFWPPQLWLQY